MTAIDTDVASAQAMFDVNVFGPMRMVHWFHDLLVESSGTIVNIGSVGGIVPYVFGCRSCFVSVPRQKLLTNLFHHSIVQRFQGRPATLVEYPKGRTGSAWVSSYKRWSH